LAFVAGAAALVSGIIGIGRANRGMVSGRGLAVAGIVLGVVGAVFALLTSSTGVG
jgi:hypothetical protein